MPSRERSGWRTDSVKSYREAAGEESMARVTGLFGGICRGPYLLQWGAAPERSSGVRILKQFCHLRQAPAGKPG